MARFTEQFLDEIRARVSVSDVVGRKIKLKKKSGREYVAVDDASFTVNDQKGIWKDFGGGGGEKAGDVFDWLTKREGYTFSKAVEELASMAGISLPDDRGGRSAGTARRAPEPARNGAGDRAPNQKKRGRAAREIAATYEYQDVDGATIYEVVRWEWIGEDGRTKKTFSQRRPAGDGRWIWALDAGVFMSKGGRDWIRYDEERFEMERYEERREFPDAVAHTLYRLPHVHEEVLQGEEGRTIFLVEGEKDVHTMERLGCLATTNSGGAKFWTEYHAELLRGADVVILADADEAGRAGAHKKARSLSKVARRVRLLDFGEHWRGIPEKGDVTDWVEKAQGDYEKLMAIVEKLPLWRPPPMASKFGRVAWRDLFNGLPPASYLWIIKDIIPAAESVLIYGASQSGKSFFTFDMAMAIARGIQYQGKRVRPGLMVYCAMEAGRGFRKRMRAYVQWHGLQHEDLPFELLTKKADLFSADVDTDELIKEIQAIADERDMPVSAVIIDTYNAATPGMKEIASEDVGKTNQRLDRIRETFKCGVWIVHHSNAQGDRPRGHTSLYAGIETAIEIRLVKDGRDNLKDENGRVVRQAWVHKQREGNDKWGWTFVLPMVEIGTDEDGDRVTSCVVTPVGRGDAEAERDDQRRQEAAKRGYLLANPNESAFLRAITRALDNYGVHPGTVGLAFDGDAVKRVVDWTRVRETYGNLNPPDADEDKTKAKDRLKKAFSRARNSMIDKLNVVGAEKPEGSEHYFAWITGKRIKMADGTWFPGEARPATVAPNETDDDKVTDIEDILGP